MKSSCFSHRTSHGPKAGYVSHNPRGSPRWCPPPVITWWKPNPTIVVSSMSPNQVASLTWPGGPTLHVCGCVLCFRETHQCRFPVFPKHLVLDQNHQSHRGFSNGCKYGDAACCPHIPSVQCFFVHNYTYTYLYMYIHDIIQLCIYMILYNYIYICRHRHIITVCVCI